LTLIRFVPRIGVAALVMTVLLAISTVYGGFHYATDAWVGAAFGVAVAAALAAARPAGALPQDAASPAPVGGAADH
jgi:membrane-associated phospholipid phosphatase